MDKLGFNTVGFGCTTCIGNSGPLDDDVSENIENSDTVVNQIATFIFSSISTDLSFDLSSQENLEIIFDIDNI